MNKIEEHDYKVWRLSNNRKTFKEIEHSVMTKFRKNIWSKFVKAVSEFNLVDDGDKIAVAISGGKDSLLMAKLFQQFQKYGQTKFKLCFIVMDPGYHKENKKQLIENCQYLKLPIQIFESGIFEIVDNMEDKNPCFMCAKMRRGALYRKANELGCNKLALGHHFDDVIETTLLNLFYTGNFKTMLPKLKSSDAKKLELIRPLYYIREKHIESYTKYCGVEPLNCACIVTAKKVASKRYETKELIKELKKDIKDVDKSIFKAAQNVNMNAILGWQKDGKHYSYLDFYNKDDKY
ncbi:tRNA 2-thiocytidine biosynthesis TtcA family protein [Crassaminicella profunda]|uniref:tRNA 2-thiocytidine biosynthesis TtcA family protein n=1 Tax=Crassaminicella profunda TaxID=1286698 RepID=UPI001CA74B76|nr:ATP-binding protein [Crassaminicella profunda]QZY57270.1 tRNA 2-thiocytidine biosynthesis protein TtcA [Crassaminicella profunda]